MSLDTEWLCGTAGLPFYFGTKRLKVTQKFLADAQKADKIIRERAKTWVNLRSPAQPPKAKYTVGDFDEVVAALDNPMDANPDLTQVPADLQVDFIAKYLDVRMWLYDHQPAIKFSSGLIAREIPPADSDKSKFMWSVNVLDDVTRVFDLLDAGCLAPSEAMALRDVYPEFIMILMVTYLKATVDYLYKNQYGALSGWQLAGLSALAGVPITSFQDVMTWQMNYEPTGPGRPQGSKAPNLAKNEASDMQALGVPV
jgi:hypothetical protein